MPGSIQTMEKLMEVVMDEPICPTDCKCASRREWRARVSHAAHQNAIAALTTLDLVLYSHLPEPARKLRSRHLVEMRGMIEDMDVAAEMAAPAPHPKEA
jgi:hypothetical protein